MTDQLAAFRASRIAVFFDGEVAEAVLDARRAAYGRWYSATSGNAVDNWALNGSWSPWYGIASGAIDVSIAAASTVPSSQNVACITVITETGQRLVHKIAPGGQVSGVNL
jgi:hypothetical protein